MPKHLNPKKLGLHRQAAIALYRALLRQSLAVPFTSAQRTSLQNITRNRFYDQRNLTSLRLIKLAFHAGYTALDLLDGSAAGNAQSTARILEYLSSVPEKLKQSPEKKVKKIKEYEHDDLEPPPLYKFMNVFPRPLDSVQRVRKVPIMVDANGFPFLRWKKPQPRSLSRVLRQNIEQRQRRITLQWNLTEYWIPLAEYEDAWDGMIRALAVEEGKGDVIEGDEVLFFTAVREELDNVVRLMNEKTQRTRELAEKMQNIVDRETEFAMEEKRRRDELAEEQKDDETNGDGQLSVFKAST